jgi:hypothetical protein
LRQHPEPEQRLEAKAMTTNANRGRHQAHPRVEELEGRQLLSVTVLPGHINLKSAGHGHGVFTVRVVNDATQATANLLAALGTLSVSAVDSSGTSTSLGSPLLSQSTGDGLVLKFSRSALKGLASGTYAVQVSDGNAADTESGSVTLFNPGKGHGHGHHDHGHHSHGHGHHKGGSQGHGW